MIGRTTKGLTPMEPEMKTTLSFSVYSYENPDVDNLEFRRVLNEETNLDAVELANFFSSVARAVGFNVSSVSIWLGNTEHPSDY